MEKEAKKQKPLEDFICLEKDPSDGVHGVLLSDEIERFAKEFELITPFNHKNLKPAGYELTVGKDYAIDGEVKELKSEHDEIRIPAFQVAILSTSEIINLPRFLIARWNLRVKCVYQGLLWLGALQVDPGYIGHLYCPIYNLSNEDVVFKLGDRFVLMDFSRTTHFNKKYLFSWENITGNDNNSLMEFLDRNVGAAWVKEGEIKKTDDGNTITISKGKNFLSLKLYREKNKATIKIDDKEIEEFIVKIDNGNLKVYKSSLEYPRPPSRLGIRDYNIKLRSALLSMAVKRIDEIDKKVNQYGERLNSSLAIVFTSISIIIAALSIFVTSKEQSSFSPPYWLYFSVALSIIALIFAIFAYTKAKGWSISEIIKKVIINIFVLTVAILLALIIFFKLLGMNVHG